MPPAFATLDRPRPASRIRPDPPEPDKLPDATKVLVVDNRPAVRSSIRCLLYGERGIGSVDDAPTAVLALRGARSQRPDVCLVSYELAESSGLILTYELKGLEQPPRVVVYADRLDGVLAGAARVAGADGVIGSTTSGRELAQVIRRVVAGERQFPIVTPAALSGLASRVEAEDRPALAMLVYDTPAADVADVLGVSERWLSARRWAMLEQFCRCPLGHREIPSRRAQRAAGLLESGARRRSGGARASVGA
ncbi:MAG TPA: response regulator [Solirubrobacteraceae bacterium]|jgi:two-component system response regulator DesR|nr:response regulator [Solirubrobacteraceae bacterium]